jgi:hypothetical protein
MQPAFEQPVPRKPPLPDDQNRFDMEREADSVLWERAGYAGLVDTARFYEIQQRVNKCEVRYGADGKVERTSSMHGAVVQTPLAGS